jgi:hypothetical protein
MAIEYLQPIMAWEKSHTFILAAMKYQNYTKNDSCEGRKNDREIKQRKEMFPIQRRKKRKFSSQA